MPELARLGTITRKANPTMMVKLKFYRDRQIFSNAAADADGTMISMFSASLSYIILVLGAHVGWQTEHIADVTVMTIGIVQGIAPGTPLFLMVLSVHL